MKASHFYIVNLVSSFLSARNIVHNRNVLKVQYEFEPKKSSIVTIANLLKDYDLQSRTYLADFDTLQKERKNAFLHLRISDGRFVMLKNISTRINSLNIPKIIDIKTIIINLVTVRYNPSNPYLILSISSSV